MADPTTYRPSPGAIPTEPGVYRFRDEHGRVIYVGKAKNLRARLSNYFQDLSALHHRTQTMVTTAAAVEWTVVGTEVEALALEYSWIKEFDPRFNVKYRDDKSYPYLAVTMAEEYPRALVLRGAKKPGTRYFGPYGHAWAIRETLDLLLRVFPLRTCSNGVFKRSTQTGRPCLLGYIDKCSAPCVGRVSEAEHRQIAEDFCDFMAGDTGKFVKRIEKRMRAAAAAQEYEVAARLRDDLAALERALEKNAVVLSDATDADIFALSGDDLEAAVQVFHVRGGRIRGQRGWVVEKVEDIDDAALVEQLIGQVYDDGSPRRSAAPVRGSAESIAPEYNGPENSRGPGLATLDKQKTSSAIPREVLVPVLPTNTPEVAAWLTGLRGSRVDVRVPQRGDKRELAETVRRNAEHALALHRTKRAGDLTMRSQALREIQEALELETAPLRIECYDVSHTQGTYQSASMVVFEDGLPRKAEYRVFSIRGQGGEGARDDTEAMYEVIARRFKRYDPAVIVRPAGSAESTGSTQSGTVPSDAPAIVSREVDPTDDPARNRRFAYPPSLIIVDGGAPQVAAARRALDDLGVTDVALVGLAKRLEEVWLPGEDYPVILPRASAGLYLMQRLRDEAHRFAIKAHRKRRSKGMTTSALDDIPGLGSVRSAALLKHFGSVKRLKAASLAELSDAPGFGKKTAAVVYAALHPEAG